MTTLQESARQVALAASAHHSAMVHSHNARIEFLRALGEMIGSWWEQFLAFAALAIFWLKNEVLGVFSYPLSWILLILVLCYLIAKKSNGRLSIAANAFLNRRRKMKP